MRISFATRSLFFTRFQKEFHLITYLFSLFSPSSVLLEDFISEEKQKFRRPECFLEGSKMASAVNKK